MTPNITHKLQITNIGIGESVGGTRIVSNQDSSISGTVSCGVNVHIVDATPHKGEAVTNSHSHGREGISRRDEPIHFKGFWWAHGRGGCRGDYWGRRHDRCGCCRRGDTRNQTLVGLKANALKRRR